MDQMTLRLELPPCTRVYLHKHSRKAHLLMPYQSPNSSVDHSLCGRIPWPHLWFGTGSQHEYDQAEHLPTCQKCEAKLKLYKELLYGES